MDQIVGMFTKVPTHDVRARHRGLCIQHERIASQSISPLFVRRLLSACALICVDALQSPYLEKNRRGLIVRGSNIEEVSVSRCGISGDGRFVSDSWLRGVIWSAELRECGILRDQQSAYQRILVVETVSLGRALILDGALQCAERDERGYAEFLAHIPLLRTGARESGLSVLILGGGDGHVAREVLRHPGVSALTLVDIDECVVAAARDLLPTLWPPSLDQDRRFKLIFADGCDYVKSSVEPGSVDLVIVDASDPIGPGMLLYCAVGINRIQMSFLVPFLTHVIFSKASSSTNQNFTLHSRNACGQMAQSLPRLVATGTCLEFSAQFTMASRLQVSLL